MSSNGNEILIQNFKTSKQRPDHDDETTEIVVVVQQDLSVVTADANTHGLRAKEDHRSRAHDFVSRDGVISNGDLKALFCQVS